MGSVCVSLKIQGNNTFIERYKSNGEDKENTMVEKNEVLKFVGIEKTPKSSDDQKTTSETVRKTRLGIGSIPTTNETFPKSQGD